MNELLVAAINSGEVPLHPPHVVVLTPVGPLVDGQQLDVAPQQDHLAAAIEVLRRHAELRRRPVRATLRQLDATVFHLLVGPDGTVETRSYAHSSPGPHLSPPAPRPSTATAEPVVAEERHHLALRLAAEFETAALLVHGAGSSQVDQWTRVRAQLASGTDRWIAYTEVGSPPWLRLRPATGRRVAGRWMPITAGGRSWTRGWQSTPACGS